MLAGDEIFPALLAAIEAAQESVCLETCIFTAGPLGDRFRTALVRAAERGVRVRVLVDALKGAVRGIAIFSGLPPRAYLPWQALGFHLRQGSGLLIPQRGDGRFMENH